MGAMTCSESSDWSVALTLASLHSLLGGWQMDCLSSFKLFSLFLFDLNYDITSKPEPSKAVRFMDRNGQHEGIVICD